MTPDELLGEALGRVRDLVPSILDGLDEDDLTWRPAPTANSTAWLVWHLSRVQDGHVAEAAGGEELWRSDGWQQRFGLDLPADDTGFGHSPEDVAKVRVGAELLAAYAGAVAARTQEFVRGLSAGDLDRVVDDSYDPPVTLGVRLVSVVDDCLQHAGQAAYVRGLRGA